MNDIQTCETCKHYAPVNAKQHAGICTRAFVVIEKADQRRFCKDYQPEMQGGAKNEQNI